MSAVILHRHGEGCPLTGDEELEQRYMTPCPICGGVGRLDVAAMTAQVVEKGNERAEMVAQRADPGRINKRGDSRRRGSGTPVSLTGALYPPPPPEHERRRDSDYDTPCPHDPDCYVWESQDGPIPVCMMGDRHLAAALKRRRDTLDEMVNTESADYLGIDIDDLQTGQDALEEELGKRGLPV